MNISKFKGKEIEGEVYLTICLPKCPKKFQLYRDDVPYIRIRFRQEEGNYIIIPILSGKRAISEETWVSFGLVNLTKVYSEMKIYSDYKKEEAISQWLEENASKKRPFSTIQECFQELLKTFELIEQV